MRVDYYELRDIYKSEINKNVKNKKRLYKFELKREQYLLNMYNEIKNNTYNGGKYNLFLIYKPKLRVIMSQSVYDKTINHYITRTVLEPKLTKYLCDNNVATRKGMGTSKGIELLKGYIEENKKYDKFYFLKLDIKKFFYSIDHSVLKNLIKKDLDSDEYEMISRIIDSTNQEYINKTIEKLGNDLPKYEYGKGLPIGNLSSQFLAIFYLSRLHHYIIHNLHIKHVVIYMDDYILIHPNKEYLKEVLQIIEEKLNNEYKLELNKSKTYIKSSNEGITFLGYNFKVINKKTIITLTSDVKRKIRKNIKTTAYLISNDKISFKSAFSSINTIKYSYKYTNSKYIENTLDKYWYK